MQSSDLKHVLVVDDEKEVRKIIKTGLAKFKNRFTIATCENGREAIEVLESQSIDLVVTDLQMPEVDGLELLAYMATHFPALPAIAISGFGTPENMQKLDEFSIYTFMDKPLSLKKLSRYIFEGLQEASQNGTVSGISIPGFLQLIESEQKTCLLEIQGKGKRKGHLYFKQGQLYDAVFDRNRGEQAALAILTWERAKLSFRNLPRRTIKRRINNSIMQLILESARLKDETEADPDCQRNEPVTNPETGASSEESSEETVYDDANWDELIEDQVDNNLAVTEGGDQEKTKETVYDDAIWDELIEDQVDINLPVTEGGDQEKAAIKENESKELPTTYKPILNYTEGRKFMPGLKETLREMSDEMDGVLAVGIAGMDGITIAAHNPSGADMDAIAAKFAMLMKLGQRSTGDIKGMGDFEENLIQSQNAWILTRFLNKSYYMALVVSREGTLGNVRLVAQKYAERFRKAL